MTNKRISAMAAAGALDGTEKVEVVKAGVNVQTTTQAIADLGGGGGATKFAYAKVASDGTIDVAGAGVTGVAKVGTGAYTIDLTAAGFTGIPVMTASPFSSSTPVGARVTVSSATAARVDLVDGFGSQADGDFSFIVIGT